MLSTIQRAKILGDIAKIASDLGLTNLEERRHIENLTDFPLIQTTFLMEGKRQRGWRDQLHEAQDPFSKEWQTLYGHFNQATISISIRSIDVDELHAKATEFALRFWAQACNWALEHTSKIEFRGSDPPRFLPPYLALDERTNIYSCVTDFIVEYEFSWPVLDHPITHFDVNSSGGTIDGDLKSVPEMHAIAPGCYVMDGIIGGIGLNINVYSMDAIILPRD